MTTTTQHHDVRRTVSLIIVYALAPGALLHELAHWVVARRWADVSIHWGVPATVRMEWSPDTPPHAVLLGHWAPLLIGWPIGAVGALAVLSGQVGVPLVVLAWLIMNWLAFATPSKTDVIPHA